MTNADWIEMFHVIPERDHAKLVIALQTGSEITVDTLVRFERNFLVMRGRVSGTTEEARGFFVPYSQMLCLRIERVMKLDELQEMLPVGPGRHPTPTNRPAAADETKEEPIPFRSSHPTPLAPTDPAAASRLLLEKIRASRAVSAQKTVGPA